MIYAGNEDRDHSTAYKQTTAGVAAQATWTGTGTQYGLGVSLALKEAGGKTGIGVIGRI